MPMQIKVTKGSVKFFPEGSHRDAEYKILKEGDTVALEPTWTGPALKADAGDGELRDLMKAQVKADKYAPAIGSASSKESGMTEGEFVVETDAAPFLARVYYETEFKDVVVRSRAPLTLKTTETNAVTAALYGVAAAA